jgi:alcohol dehydrogenase
VEIRFADVNLVALPETVDFVTAASLGCRFSTSFRAVLHQGRVRGGDWVAVHGCGGVGLSAVMISDVISLEQGAALLPRLQEFPHSRVTVIEM